jgi:hypothetical protein
LQSDLTKQFTTNLTKVLKTKRKNKGLTHKKSELWQQDVTSLSREMKKT